MNDSGEQERRPLNIMSGSDMLWYALGICLWLFANSVSKSDRQRKPFKLSLAQSDEDSTLRWLILDGWKITQRYGRGHNDAYRGIAIAVQELWDRGHRKLVVCVPESMKQHSECHETGLQDQLQDLLVYTPSEARRTSFMEKLAKMLDGLIVTQLGPDAWSEPNRRILQFTFIFDSFDLPEDPWGNDGPSLSSLLRSKTDTKELSIQKLVQDLLEKWKNYFKLLKELEHLELSLTDIPGQDDLPMVIIDGSNVAMSHGLNVFYSCFGIYRAVQHFWNKGYRNIIVCVENWRMNSINTVYGHTYLQDLDKRGLISRTPSQAYEDRIMLKAARNKNAWIVTNDKFREFKQDWKATKTRCIPFEFDRNIFIALKMSTEAVCKSSVHPIDTGEGKPHLHSSGQTPQPDP